MNLSIIAGVVSANLPILIVRPTQISQAKKQSFDKKNQLLFIILLKSFVVSHFL